MNFTLQDDDDDPTKLLRIVSDTGLVEIFVYRVMFGFRVRCGFAGYMACELDWCAGGDWIQVQILYAMAKAILSRREEDYDCFNGIPTVSRVKPFFNDAEFLGSVTDLAGDFAVEKLPIQDRVIAW